ncbi:hypothetical protein ACFYP4_09475 [Streptomyces sp. NPDC005551]|uniref:hypothetical protein n=1 Tax=unclassified Streptomyces TaxID=2593676 RepID=UPI00340C5ED5
MQAGKRVAVTGALAATLLAAAPAAVAGDRDASVGVTREKGHAVACQAEQDGIQVSLELYENSAFGTHIGLSLEADGQEYGGGGPVEHGLFDQGVISGQVAYNRLEETAGEEQVARIQGSYEVSGPRVRVREVYQEPWGEVVSKGWRTPLAAEVSLNVLGRQVQLTCGEAFAFDLRVKRIGSAARVDGRAG